MQDEVYVANSDSDDVSVLDGSTGAVLRRINLVPYPNAPAGSQPNALAVSPDGGTLYVANAGDNDIAVVRLVQGSRRQDTVAGLIPTAWYPSGVQVVNGGTQLLVTSAKGLGVGPNPGGPDASTGDDGPAAGTPPDSQYILGMMRGALSIIGIPSSAELARETEQVHRNDGFDQNGPTVSVTTSFGSVIPRRPGLPPPIKHVIFVDKENRTYDQILGDLGRGNGDPNLTLFGPDVIPNQHRLGQPFVTLDNYYANGEVTNEGWSWVSAANSNTHNEKYTPGVYTFNGRATSPTAGNSFVDNPGPPAPGNRPRWPRCGQFGRRRTVPGA